jgi:hypothetical protein
VSVRVGDGVVGPVERGEFVREEVRDQVARVVARAEHVGHAAEKVVVEEARLVGRVPVHVRQGRLDPRLRGRGRKLGVDLEHAQIRVAVEHHDVAVEVRFARSRRVVKLAVGVNCLPLIDRAAPSARPFGRIIRELREESAY